MKDECKTSPKIPLKVKCNYIFFWMSIKLVMTITYKYRTYCIGGQSEKLLCLLMSCSIQFVLSLTQS